MKQVGVSGQAQGPLSRLRRQLPQRGSNYRTQFLPPWGRWHAQRDGEGFISLLFDFSVKK